MYYWVRFIIPVFLGCNLEFVEEEEKKHSHCGNSHGIDMWSSEFKSVHLQSYWALARPSCGSLQREREFLDGGQVKICFAAVRVQSLQSFLCTRASYPMHNTPLDFMSAAVGQC